MKLYHISDNSNIDYFKPRIPTNTKAWPNLAKSYVWSVSDEMVHNYYFPRFCPRVCRMIGPQSSQQEKDLFHNNGIYKSIIHVEESRRKEIESCVLYRYEFNLINFYPVDYDAGYYISEKVEYPTGKVKIENLLDILQNLSVKVQWVKNLKSHRQDNSGTGYRYSNIRMAYIKEPDQV